jgi:hypothetical protein
MHHRLLSSRIGIGLFASYLPETRATEGRKMGEKCAHLQYVDQFPFSGHACHQRDGSARFPARLEIKRGFGSETERRSRHSEMKMAGFFWLGNPLFDNEHHPPFFVSEKVIMRGFPKSESGQKSIQ